jgi:alkylated DNA repair dioxygenase AlkB
MNLFESIADENLNLLPFDGVVNYYGPLFSKNQADDYLKKLMDEIPWENDRHIIFGKEIITKRKMAWFGDQPFTYTYSHIPRKAHLWIPLLLELKNKIEDKSGDTFNSCLLNLYHSGDEGMGWHADDEKELKPNGAIASVSFGAERKFAFKHKKTAQGIQTNLEHGSLLVMKGATQSYWLHRLPVTKKVSLPRINLTFRTIVSSV